ncbi:uncharacterized protein LOC132196029 [Neocloeon triangulifer]|uniref:uncharacterized protein LOC132196029 n=1 Tax=Neocloeon triangulifer TaxID=2078957 RepID=UPI00286EF9C5|nr:uncharacterized protein LOC132196029 [Neocloeon triangulifer]
MLCSSIKIKTFVQKKGILNAYQTREKIKLHRKIIVSCCGKLKCSEISKQTNYSRFSYVSTSVTTKHDLQKISSVFLPGEPKVSSDFETTLIDQVRLSSTNAENSQFTAGIGGNSDQTTVQLFSSSQLPQIVTIGPPLETVNSLPSDQSAPTNIADSTLPPSATVMVDSSGLVTTSASPNIQSNGLALGIVSNSVLTLGKINPATSDLTTSTITKTTTITPTTTTTTTKPRLCQSSACGYYKNGTKALQSSTVSQQVGKYSIITSTMFYIITELTTLKEAVISCLQKNMAVISVPTINDMEIYVKLWKTNKGSTVNYWTSGANDGSFCDVENVYTWCAPNVTVAPDDVTMLKYWSIAKTFNAITDRCIAIQFNATSASIYFTQCENKLAYICGPSCKTPSCPATCKANDTLFLADGSIKEPEKHGYIASICGNKYLFGNSIGTWRENYDKCCSLGMTPIIIETAQEQSCLSNFTNSNWTLNFNYWTGGTQQGCRGRWAWCSSSGLLDLNDNLTWSSGQPDNKAGNEECLHMRLNQNSSGVVLSDRNCTDKYVFACKGQPKVPACQVAKCPSYECTKNTTLFDAEDQLRNYSGYGNWFSSCGRTFLFSNFKTNWSGAYNVCCSIGMTLLAVEYGDKHRCISDFVKDSSLVNIDFWTSGSDKDCDGRYRWCSIERDFISRDVNWKSGAPDSIAGDCVSVNFSNTTANQSTYATNNCSKELLFICEVRNTGTTSDALQKECMEIWNVSSTDMLVFLTAYNASKIQLNLKCFIKCIGENLNMFSLGGLSPSGDVLRLIEDINNDEVDLQRSFNAYDTCNSKRYSDECVTAANIYQCGRENDPMVTNAIFSSKLGNNTIYKPPTPCIGTPFRKCRMLDRPCVANSTLVNLLQQNPKTTEGAIVTGDNGGKYFVSSCNLPITHYQAYDYCCSYGMRLAEFETKAQFDEIWLRLINWCTGYAYVGETFANGDGTDSWCRSKTVIPTAMYYLQKYTPPVCEKTNCYAPYFFSGLGASLYYLENDAGKHQNCELEYIDTGYTYFICE